MKLKITIVFCLFLAVFANAQVSINILVNPPYSPYYEDYLQYDNKVIVIMTNNSASPKEIFLKGSVVEDNGIMATTKANYKPLTPIVLPANGVVQLSGGDLEEYLSFDNIDLKGISIEELVNSDGLPPGYYQICVQAFDFMDNTPLSQPAPIGCSPSILLEPLEPPIINFPICETEVMAIDPQNVLFSWSMNNSFNANYGYILEIAEMEDGQHPGASLDALSSPAFFEKFISTNSYIYGISDPPLTVGKQYTFRVQVLDQLGEAVFRNDGFSEICTFTYGISEIIDTAIPDDVFVDPNQDVFNFFSAFDNTSISGKLLYRFRDDNEISVSTNGTINTNSFFAEDNSSSTIGNTISGFSYMDMVESGSNTNSWNSVSTTGSIIENINVDAVAGDPFYSRNPFKGLQYLFGNTVTPGKAKPLTGTNIYLMEYTGFLEGEGPLEDRNLEYNPEYMYKITNNSGGADEGEVSFMLAHSRLVASTTSGTDGTFTFDFHMEGELRYVGNVTLSDPGRPETIIPEISILPKDLDQVLNNPVTTNQIMTMGLNGAWTRTGEMYKCLKIVVGDSRFYSPDIDIFPSAGEHITIPDQVALLNDYSVKIKVKAEDEAGLFPDAEDALHNAEVRILRDRQKLNIKKEILESEGQQLNSYTHAFFVEFKDIAFDSTDHKGIAEIDHLICSKYGDPYYFMQISTRNFVLFDDYENTSHNYWTHYQEMQPSWFPVSNTGPAKIFNRYYYKKIAERTFKLKAKLPEIKGRINEKSDNFESVGLENVNIYLQKKSSGNSGSGGPWSWITNIGQSVNSGFVLEEARITPQNGRFRFTDLEIKFDAKGSVTGPKRKMKIDKYGYEKVYRPLSTEWILSKGELKDIKDIYLTPMGKIKGVITGENGEPIDCLVNVEEGARYKTEMKGGQSTFEMLAEKGQGVELRITPFSNDYVEQVFNVDVPRLVKGQYKDLGVFRLNKYQRKLIVAVELDNGKTAIGARVELESMAKNIGTLGKTYFDFKGSKTTYRLKVTYDGYVPYQKYVSIPNSNQYKNISITLKSGKSLSGYVKVARANTPIPNAKVSALINVVDGHELRIESTTDNQGRYNLNGIPNNLSSIKIEVSKEGGNPLYIGSTDMINVPNKSNSKDFFLISPSNWDLQEVWGFPLAITQLDNYSNNAGTISGYFYGLPSRSDFSTDENLRVYFSSLKIIRDSSGKLVPTTNSIQLAKSFIPIKVQNEFDAKLVTRALTHTGFSIGENLKLQKDNNDKGYINGAVRLNSLPIENTIYVGKNGTDPFINAFEITNSNQRSLLYAFDVKNSQKKKLSNLELFGFKGNVELEDARVSGGIITMKPSLTVELKLATPSSIPIKIGEIKISKDAITKGSGDIIMQPFKLENWTVTPKKALVLNTSSTLFKLPKVEINTGNGIIIKIDDLLLHENELKGGNIQLSGGLSLAGVANIKVAEGVRPLFNFDEKHYRVTMTLDDKSTAAYITGLDGFGNQRLNFKTLALQSNNENPISLSQNIRFRDIMNITVDQLVVGENDFVLSGMPDLGINGEILVGCSLRIFKDGNKPKTELSSLKGKVVTQGRVDFVLDDKSSAYQNISQKEFWSYGDIMVKSENDLPSEAFKIRGRLIKNQTGTKIEIIKTDGARKVRGNNVQKLTLGDPNSYFTVMEDEMKLVNGKWNLLEFDAKPLAYEGMENTNSMHFVVYGKMEVGASGVEASNINTPLGNLSMIYNFQEQSLEGNLNISKPINMGFARINQGSMTTRFDASGFYMALGADVTIGESIFAQGGILLGSSSNVKSQHTYKMISYFSLGGDLLPQSVKSGSVEGIFVGGQRVLINEFMVLGFGGLDLNAALGGYFQLDFGNNAKAVLGGYAYAKAEVVTIGIPPCPISFGVEGRAVIEGGYSESQGVKIGACGSLGLGVNICGYALDGSLGNSICYSSANGFDISFFLGACKSVESYCDIDND